MRAMVLGLALSMMVSACGGDDEPGGAAGGSGGSTSSTTSSSGGGTSSGGAGGSSACDDPPFVAEAEDAGSFQGVFRYIAQSTLGAPVDVLSFELIDGAPASPTAITLSDDGYEACSTCVVLYRGCDANLANCQQTLLAQGGILDVAGIGGSGATFAGELVQAQLVEVTIDPSTFVSTAVPGGESVCWASYAFSATVQ